VLLDAVTAAGGQVWAAGEAASPADGGRPLIEHLENGTWQTARLPADAGTDWTSLYGVTTSSQPGHRQQHPRWRHDHRRSALGGRHLRQRRQRTPPDRAPRHRLTGVPADRLRHDAPWRSRSV
jgi:hypothetical protein